MPLERALELLNQAQNLDEWEELYELEQHLNGVIAGGLSLRSARCFNRSIAFCRIRLRRQCVYGTR